MWGQDNKFDGGGGGGFIDSTFSSPSADGGEKKKDRRAENVVPVTIDQILKSDQEFKIGEVLVHVVTFVGMVKNIDISSTKVTYLIGDSTGEIEALLWLEGPVGNSQPSLNSYCRVAGTVRTTQGRRHIMLFHMQPLTDLNDLTVHLLEVIDVHQNAPHFSEMENMTTQMNSTDSMNKPLQNSMMNMNPMDEGMDQHAPSDPQQRLVFKAISDAAVDDEGGVNVQYITKKLNGRLSENQVRTLTDHLLHEGFIFSTIDDEHFTVTR